MEKSGVQSRTYVGEGRFAIYSCLTFFEVTSVLSSIKKPRYQVVSIIKENDNLYRVIVDEGEIK